MVCKWLCRRETLLSTCRLFSLFNTKLYLSAICTLTERQRDTEREREVWKRNNWTMCWYHWVYWCLDYTTFGFCSLSSAFPDEPSLVSMLKLATNGSSPWWVLSPSSLSLSLSLSLSVYVLYKLWLAMCIYIYVCVCVSEFTPRKTSVLWEYYCGLWLCF